MIILLICVLEKFLLEWVLDWTLRDSLVVDPPVLINVSVHPSVLLHHLQIFLVEIFSTQY